MSVYTNKAVLVADTLEELHAFAKSMGLMQQQHFTDHRRRPHYKIPPGRLKEAYALGAQIQKHSFIEEKARAMRKWEETWYERATDEQIEFKVGSWKQYIASGAYLYHGIPVSGAVLTEMSILMFKSMRDGTLFDDQEYCREASAEEKARKEKEQQEADELAAITEALNPLANLQASQDPADSAPLPSAPPSEPQETE